MALGGKKFIEYFGQNEEEAEPDQAASQTVAEEPTPDMEEIKEQETKLIEEVLDYNKEGKLEFNLGAVEELKQYWRNQYTENPKMVKSLRDAYYKMGAWKPYLLIEFEKAGMTAEQAEELIYLAIPESHWQLKAVSRTKAVGPYQFMKKTARSFGLNTGRAEHEIKNLDERMDPLKSARACARNLLDIYRKADEDMDVALSGYNGGFVWRYLSDVNAYNDNRKKGEDRQTKNYKGFVSYIEGEINNLRDYVKNDQLVYKVKKGDTLDKIAHKYYTTATILQNINQIDDPRQLKINQVIKISIPEEKKMAAFNDLSSGYAENMVYPAKFNAIKELINENFVTDDAEAIEFDTITVNQIKSEALYNVKNGDNLFRIGLHYGTTVKMIKAFNGLKDANIRPGDKLKIPQKHKPISMAEFAQNNGYDLHKLMELNSGIIDTGKPMPENYELRIPHK